MCDLFDAVQELGFSMGPRDIYDYVKMKNADNREASLEKTFDTVERNLQKLIKENWGNYDSTEWTYLDAYAESLERRPFKTPDNQYLTAKVLEKSNLESKEDGIIVLYSPQLVEQVVEATKNIKVHLSLDATYHIVPQKLYIGKSRSKQAFNVVIEVFGRHILVMTFFMSRKRKEDYSKVLGFAKELLSDVEVKLMTSDFETNIGEVGKQYFEQAVIHRCSFHFDQAITRKFEKKLKIKSKLEYLIKQNKGEATRFVTLLDAMNDMKYKIMALVYVPTDVMQTEFDKIEMIAIDAVITAQLQLKNKVEKALFEAITAFLRYVRKEWFRKQNPYEYNCFENYTRTNNPVENIHSLLNASISKNPDAINLTKNYAKFVDKMASLLREAVAKPWVENECPETTRFNALLKQKWTKYGSSPTSLNATDIVVQIGAYIKDKYKKKELQKQAVVFDAIGDENTLQEDIEEELCRLEESDSDPYDSLEDSCFEQPPTSSLPTTNQNSMPEKKLVLQSDDGHSVELECILLKNGQQAYIDPANPSIQFVIEL